MATGKKAKDIFQPTARPKVDLEVAPRYGRQGRKPAEEEYSKVTVCLYDRHTLLLDKACLAVRELTGQRVFRAELLRAIVEVAVAGLDPSAPDFGKKVKALLDAPRK